MSADSSTPLRWRQAYADLSLPDILARHEDAVRRAPKDAHARWMLLETLCLLGQWQRAFIQLDACLRLDDALRAPVRALRALLLAEQQREAVLAGQARPLTATAMPDWMDALWRANQHNAAGSHDQADTLRRQALAHAPTAAGLSNLGHCAWLADSDTRLGPICELVLADGYHWRPFASVRALQLDTPRHTLDLIWQPAHIQLDDSPPQPGWLPSRYPLHADADDSHRLARATSWRDVGDTGVFAHGQKTWMHAEGDWPLLELRQYSRQADTEPGHGS